MTDISAADWATLSSFCYEAAKLKHTWPLDHNLDAGMPNVRPPPKDRDLEADANRLKALGSSVRLRILLMLLETKRPLHIKAVAQNLSMEYTAVYRHVETLKQAGILEVYEVGRSRVLTPARPDSIKALLQLLSSLGEKPS